MKIETKDLRIGNLFNHKGKVIIIHPIDIYNYSEGEFEIKPIPITEDILLKNCKFTSAKDTDSFGGFLSPELPNGNKIRLKKDGNVFVWNTQHAIVKLEFLHELQNFYSIFNTELEINLNN